jgi:hypothetical protein
MASLIIYRGLTREWEEVGSEIWTDEKEVGVEFTLPISEISEEEKEKLIETFGNLARRLAYFINGSLPLLRSHPEAFFFVVRALDKAIDDVSETTLEFIKNKNL